jgi:hypothetical protein
MEKTRMLVKEEAKAGVTEGGRNPRRFSSPASVTHVSGSARIRSAAKLPPCAKPASLIMESSRHND